MGSPVFWFRATGPTVCVVNQEKKCRGPAGLRLGRNKPPVGCFRMWSSSKPFTVAAIAPGRYRGCGRNPLACIHTQMEPSFSPLGAATNTVIPEGFPDVWTLKQGIRKPFKHGGSTGEEGTRLVRPWTSCPLPRCRSRAKYALFSRRRGARGFPHGRGMEPCHHKRRDMAFGFRAAQDARALLLRLRGIARLCLPLSTG